MSLSESDIKKLWGLSAGICSHPDCNFDCIQFIEVNSPTVLGEMAHVIARSPKGPRGNGKSGDDTYANTILLCPTHHSIIDKSPEGTYPAEMLHEWKRRHEAEVRSKLNVVAFVSKRELCSYIARLLIENKELWRSFGPESETARANPMSNIATLWQLRKLSHVIPNNSTIIKLVDANKKLLDLSEYKICAKFQSHATAFESSTYQRLDNVPRFPLEFEEFIMEASK